MIIEALTVESPVFRMQTSDRARQFVGVKLADLDLSSVVGMTKTWVAKLFRASSSLFNQAV